MTIRLVLNGEPVSDDRSPPDMTVLDWLRGVRRLSGTKEGCGEGDCGACTVAVGRIEDGRLHYRAVNSCLALLAQIDGAAVVTVEGVGRDGMLHPVQQALLDTHGTQCGFCTPGIVMSMFAFHHGGERADDGAIHDMLAGNLCRCTGYRPVVEACRAVAGGPAPAVMALPERGAAHEAGGRTLLAPATLDELHRLRKAHPDAPLWAGGTDLGLLASKERRHFPVILSTARVAELRRIAVGDDAVVLGAAVTYAISQDAMDAHFPALGALLRRLGSRQIRNLGTYGGNLGTASPIGDTLPCLLALEASVVLSSPAGSRTVPLDGYFLDYRKTARRADEVIQAIRIPRLSAAQHFAVYKVSKRFDQDISTVLGAFRIDGDEARLAFGGMAAVPRRATTTEVLLKAAYPRFPSRAALRESIARDFAPLSDLRGSAAYRLDVAANLLVRLQAERAGVTARLEQL